MDSLQPGKHGLWWEEQEETLVSGFPNSGLPAERTHRAGSL